MTTEDEIKKMAYKLWKDEGEPEGKHLEHYFRAARMLQGQDVRNPSVFAGKPSPAADMSSTVPARLVKRGSKPGPTKMR